MDIQSMNFSQQINVKKIPRNKVELHIHLDGSIRLETLWEIGQKKSLLPEDVKTLKQLQEKCIKRKPSTLLKYLEAHMIAYKIFCNDLEAVERIAYEFCEDSANDGILYSEVRYTPHLFCTREKEKRTVTPKSVLESILKGLKRGEVDFNIKVRSILCCIRRYPEWSSEILDLCREFPESIVGIDICGPERNGVGSQEDIEVFQKAEQYGIHRTVHAGEVGPAENVIAALNEMKAERIGHGYHVMADESMYQECLRKGVHFEVCPTSSFLTGSIPVNCPKHFIVRLAEDNGNFSISRDDILVTNTVFKDEYELLKKMGLNEAHFCLATFRAANNCFLPDDEKEQLLKDLLKIYGIILK